LREPNASFPRLSQPTPSLALSNSCRNSRKTIWSSSTFRTAMTRTWILTPAFFNRAVNTRDNETVGVLFSEKDGHESLPSQRASSEAQSLQLWCARESAESHAGQ